MHKVRVHLLGQRIVQRQLLANREHKLELVDEASHPLWSVEVLDALDRDDLPGL